VCGFSKGAQVKCGWVGYKKILYYMYIIVGGFASSVVSVIKLLVFSVACVITGGVSRI
jgi:hypothetical protein